MASDIERALSVAQSWVGTVAGVAMVASGEVEGVEVIEVWVTSDLEPRAVPAELHGIRVVRHDTEGFRALPE
jgi:hypothetical protein